MWDEDCRISAASGFSRYISREVITRTVAYLWGLALQVSLSLNTDSWKQIPFASVGVVFLALSFHRHIPNDFFLIMFLHTLLLMRQITSLFYLPHNSRNKVLLAANIHSSSFFPSVAKQAQMTKP